MAETHTDEELEARSSAVLERLRADPKVAPLIAELERDLGEALNEHAAEAQIEGGRRDHPPPCRSVAVAAAKVMVDGASLDTVAEETGIPREEFVQLEAGDPRARTAVALRVLEQIDAFWDSVPRTLGGTARIPVPAEAQPERKGPPSERPVNVTGRRVSVNAVLAAGEAEERAEADRASAGTRSRKNVTGTERLDVPDAVRDEPSRNITGTVRLASPAEEELEVPLDEPRRAYVAVALLLALIALAWWSL